ncbi:hypothetical protein PENSPDRAFT_659637 [Peniophora sp. CONT]|nr:hypothetical protein PENSPDRAFT_659637 [Peniophora sp. CONT]
MAIKIKAPGMKEFAEVLPALWHSIYAIVTEMVVEIPSTPEEMRLHMLTTVGTSLIVVNTPSENYNLKVNILVATGLDLKMIIELYTAVPVERQILNPCIGDEIRDEETLRNSGVAAGRYSNEVTMKIKPKDTAPILDVVV